MRISCWGAFRAEWRECVPVEVAQRATASESLQLIKAHGCKAAHERGIGSSCSEHQRQLVCSCIRRKATGTADRTRQKLRYAGYSLLQWRGRPRKGTPMQCSAVALGTAGTMRIDNLGSTRQEADAEHDRQTLEFGLGQAADAASSDRGIDIRVVGNARISMLVAGAHRYCNCIDK